MKAMFFVAFFLSIPLVVLSQSTTYSLNDDYNNHIIDRAEILSGQQEVFTSFKPLQRDEIAALIQRSAASTKQDIFNHNYLLQDNWEHTDSVDYISEKPFLKKLYRSKSDLYHHHSDELDFHVNPIFGFQIGKDWDTEEIVYRNTRGVEVRGSVDQKVYFYTSFTENQLRYPAYIRQYQLNNGAIPGLGFWKLLDENAYDFIFAKGHISFNATKHINFQLGHDRFFIGNGYRSLLLSDFSNNYPYFKIGTKGWKLQYTNLYAQLIADVGYFSGGTLGVDQFPKKFMSMHHLSFNLTPNFNVGLFESIIFARTDSLGTSNQFEWNYMNPIILYRSVEQYTGSPDNAILGLDLKWNLAKRVSLYGQFLVDEFIVSNVKNDKGNWTNKFAFQVGGKFINAFNINNLDLQAEYNFARPFTYTHESFYTNYAHYNQPLAHPRGANFQEFLGIMRYQPIPRLFIRGRIMVSQHGNDPEDENLGSDILEPYTTRTRDDEHFVGQGETVNLVHSDLRVSYQLKHNLFLDFNQVFRSADSAFPRYEENTTITTVGLRLNLATTDILF